VALYRSGAIARVQRQFKGDVFLLERENPASYPVIPTDPVAEVSALEPGCSSPVNEAPARAVTACAALACEIVIDGLSDRLMPDEVTEVFKPLSEPPFDRIGRLGSA
jgi:hypothetical protein